MPHTPAPWNWNGTCLVTEPTRDYPDGYAVAKVFNESDVALIAAAPAMLAALQSALSDAKPSSRREYWRDSADGKSSELVREETWPDWIAAARAAIRAATGE